MINKQSKKHHYLPRHYLRGFTNDDGSFYAYDKINDKVFLTNPDNTFFENDLNTVTTPKGDRSVFVEDQYTNIENVCWPSLDKIRESNTKKAVSYSDKEFLYLFLLFQYWRLPINIPAVEEISETAFTRSNPVDYFQIKNKNGESVPKKIIEHIRGSDAF